MKSIKASIVGKLLAAVLCVTLICGPGDLVFAKTKESSNVVKPNWMTCYSTYEVYSMSNPWTYHCDFVRYLTGSWATASYYTWQTSESTSLSFTMSLSGGGQNAVKTQFGLTASHTTSYSVAITIPADSTRFSKLAFGSDFNCRQVKVVETKHYRGTEINEDDVMDPVFTTYHEPTSNTYLYVIYQ